MNLGSKSHRSLRADLDAITKKQSSNRVHQNSEKHPPARNTIIYHRDLPRLDARTSLKQKTYGPPVVLDECVEGRIVDHGKGQAYAIKTKISTIDGGERINDLFSKGLFERDPYGAERVKAQTGDLSIRPEQMIFVDIETAGLGSSPLFLIGVMLWENGGFEVVQYLARNYAEEPAVVSLFEEALNGKVLVISFNGKSFDLPFIRARAAANGIKTGPSPAHFDLLHEGRRIWKGKLPDCKLQTLERHICGRVRHGDIPGDQIPDAYHAYARTGDARQIIEILKHNMLDLITLADIMTRFPRDES